MLGVMHEADPYGHLLVNGQPVTDSQLASLCGVQPDQIAMLLTELDNAGAYSRNATGVIYSRRMTRDAKKAKIARRNGKHGGNPNLRDSSGIPPSDNPYLNLKVKLKRTEDREEKERILSDLDQILDLTTTRLRTTGPPWTAEQKKAAWQSRICAEARRIMPAAVFDAFMKAWFNGDPRAQAAAEQIDQTLKRRKVR